MLCYTDGADTRPTATMRNAESLVEVEMADTASTDITWASKADLGIHVCAIHVHLTTIAVNSVNNGLDFFLEDTIWKGR